MGIVVTKIEIIVGEERMKKREVLLIAGLKINNKIIWMMESREKLTKNK